MDVTALNLVAPHMIGDYVLQSHWMATCKTKRWLPALAHGAAYTLPYLVVTRSVWALLVIGGTHVIIDRYRLARYVVWFKNLAGPRRTWAPVPHDPQATGFTSDTPAWLAVWLLIIVDNLVHLAINWAALMYLA